MLKSYRSCEEAMSNQCFLLPQINLSNAMMTQLFLQTYLTTTTSVRIFQRYKISIYPTSKFLLVFLNMNFLMLMFFGES